MNRPCLHRSRGAVRVVRDASDERDALEREREKVRARAFREFETKRESKKGGRKWPPFAPVYTQLSASFYPLLPSNPLTSAIRGQPPLLRDDVRFENENSFHERGIINEGGREGREEEGGGACAWKVANTCDDACLAALPRALAFSGRVRNESTGVEERRRSRRAERRRTDIGCK